MKTIKRLMNKFGGVWTVEHREVEGNSGYATTYRDRGQVALGRQLSDEERSRGREYLDDWLSETPTGATRLRTWRPQR